MLIFLNGMQKVLSPRPTNRRSLALVCAALVLTVACGGSFAEARRCQMNEDIRVEIVPSDLRIPGFARFAIVVNTEDQGHIELSQFDISGATYVESDHFSTYLRLVISPTESPVDARWEHSAGVVDSVRCTLGEYVVEGLVDDGTARLRLGGIESTRPVPEGESGAQLIGPLEMYIAQP